MCVNISNIFIQYRCPRAIASPCHRNPCKNGGVCHDLWSDYLCECKSPFTGRSCATGKTCLSIYIIDFSQNCELILKYVPMFVPRQTEMSQELVLRFNGNDYIEYVIKERYKRDYLLKDLLKDEKQGNTENQTAINIKFKTQDNGVLMFVHRQTGYSMFKVGMTYTVCR